MIVFNERENALRTKKVLRHIAEGDVIVEEQALRTSMEIKKLDKPVLMCLCPVCAKPFYNSKEHFIIRADQNQTIKGTCMFCNVRQGYDYLIRKKYY